MNIKTGRRSQLLLSQLIAAVLLIPGAAQASDVGAQFIHIVTVDNVGGGVSRIDHPLTNNDLSAIVHVTQNWNPGGVGGVYNDHVVGVWYHDGIEKWAVFSQDGVSMPDGASFNFSTPSRKSALFVHTADPGSINGHRTIIDNPLSNDNPNATVSVTQNWNPGGVGGVFNDHTFGAYYSSSFSKWAIFNQDFAAMPDGASFNISIPAVDASTFVHGATAGNITLNWTTIDNPVTNGDPNAIVHVTQNWNPSGAPGVYNDHNIGVWYTGADWAIFNQDDAPMPEGASFNVTVVDPPFFSDGFESGNTSAWSATTP